MAAELADRADLRVEVKIAKGEIRFSIYKQAQRFSISGGAAYLRKNRHRIPISRLVRRKRRGN